MSAIAHIDKAARKVTGSVTINAPREVIFELLADPRKHQLFDGSGMLQDTISGPARLAMGDKFSIAMKLGPVPYRISNKVVEFDEGTQIAWQHVGKHRWRYQLETVDAGTVVTETFDWSTSICPPAIEAVGYPTAHRKNIAETLGRLATLVEASPA